MISSTLNKLFALILLIILLLPFVIIAIIILLDSNGPAIIWSRRIGYKSSEFKMPKFRTMLVDTPQVATHLLSEPDTYVTRFGKFLRKTSIDELPQIISILKGDMNFIGPRPALFNQYDLIDLRKELHIDESLPGITGWAQVNGRDNTTIKDKIELDNFYIKNRGIKLNVKIVFMTLSSIFELKNVRH
tara:strand:+ start:70 stop:633 length:564 start_codon:yes stop_codon:yes gene_type:complete